MTNQVRHYEEISNTLTTDHGLNNRDSARFHYFNVNGLYQKKKAMDNTISQYVDDGFIPSGWIIAYGTFNSYYTDRISNFAMKQRVRRISLETTLEGLQDAIDKGYTRLGEFILESNES